MMEQAGKKKRKNSHNKNSFMDSSYSCGCDTDIPTCLACGLFTWQQ